LGGAAGAAGFGICAGGVAPGMLPGFEPGMLPGPDGAVDGPGIEGVGCAFGGCIGAEEGVCGARNWPPPTI